MKYSVGEYKVSAIYNDEIHGNPFLEAMPEMLSWNEFKEHLISIPNIPSNTLYMEEEERKQFLMSMYKIFIPMDYMFYIYDTIYRAIALNYMTKSNLEFTRAINNLYFEREERYTTQSYSGAILGVPGIGKTSTIKRCLDFFPKVITHTFYKGKKMYENQVPSIFVQCPSDCSIKALCLNVLTEIDAALGSDYTAALSTNAKENTLTKLMMRVKMACLRHRVGIIIIDEIQNVINTAVKARTTKTLLKFLLELTNASYVSVLFCGTLDADDVFNREEYIKRRTRGFRLVPMKKDLSFHRLLEITWNLQVIYNKTPLTPQFETLVYNLTKGVPAYVVQLLVEVQTQAMLSGEEKITEKNIKETAAMMGINVSQIYTHNTSISDFKIVKSTKKMVEAIEEKKSEEIQNKNEENIKTVIDIVHPLGRKRGRPEKTRSNKDIKVFYQNSKDKETLIQSLTEFLLLERIKL